MNLKVGIVGLPNVGKSTLFNALMKRQVAYAANFPFATIEPNVGIVPVPDLRLNKLAEITKESEKMDSLPPIVNATVEFVDIAGIVKGASTGAGLGNKFLSHIREVDAICYTLRAFSDPDVIREGSTDPKADFEILKTELILADLQTVQSSKERNKKAEAKFRVLLDKLEDALMKGTLVKDITVADEEIKELKQFNFLTIKPILVVLNVDEKDLKSAQGIEIEYAQKLEVKVEQVIAISAKIESELSDLNEGDQKKYLEDLGVRESGLERLAKKAFETLGLITFLTAGAKEVRAWTIKAGIDAQNAAGVIHTDFIKKFIKADVADFKDFVELGGWKAAREKGKVRSEGRDYIMQDGDVVEFKIGA